MELSSPVPIGRAVLRLGFLPTALAALAALVLAWTFILAHPWMPTIDQAALLGWANYPTYDQEIVPRLVEGALYAIGPRDLVGANLLLRLLSAALYIGTAALLAQQVLRRNSTRFAFLALLTASAFPVLWLSSELIAGALVCLAVWLAMMTRHHWLLGMILAALALTKSELIVMSLAIGALYLRRNPEAWRSLLAGFIGLGLVLILPGALIHRGAFFYTTRAWVAFGQHYASALEPLQIGPHPEPWGHWDVYATATLPGASSVPQVILHYPKLYTDFVSLSVVTGIWNAAHALGLILVAIGIRIMLRSPNRQFEKWLLVSLVVLLPEVLLSYPHIRYMAKLVPLALMVPLAELEDRRDMWRYALGVTLVLGGILLFVDRLLNPGIMPWFGG